MKTGNLFGNGETISCRFFIYKCAAGNAPSYFFHFNHVSHEYFTIGFLYDLEERMPNREMFGQYFIYQGTITWDGAMFL